MMEKKYPKLSVILPAYNAEKFLKESIDSVLSQTFSDFELIILNDGSSDCTEDIILSYTDDRIRYIKNEQNLKLIKTLNKGIDNARGQYIARMDADDICLPRRFEEEIDYLDKHSDIAVVSCYPININEEGVYIGKTTYFCVTRPLPCKFVSMFESSICHPSCMMRADSIRKYMYNDTPKFLHIEAFELWNRMFRNGERGYMIPKYLLKYRDNSTSVCHVNNGEQEENQLELLIDSVYVFTGLRCDKKIAKCIIERKAVNDIDVIRNTKKFLTQCAVNFYDRESELTCLDKKEITKWCDQRILAILLNSLLNTAHKRAFAWELMKNLHLFFSIQNLRYVKFQISKIIKYKR